MQVIRLINRPSPADKSYVQKPILIPLADLREEPPFNDVFMISPQTLEDIKDNMLKEDYDAAKPVVVWKEKGILVDGHARLKAARELVKEGYLWFGRIPVIEKSFKDEQAALGYTYHAQFHQRNLNDADILRAVEKIDKLSPNWGGYRQKARFANEKLDSRVATANIIGTNTNKISQARRVLKKGNPDVIAAVMNGEVTLRKAHDNPAKIEVEKDAEATRERTQERIRIEINQKLDDKTLAGKFNHDKKPSTNIRYLHFLFTKARYFCILLRRLKATEALLDKIIDEIDLWESGEHGLDFDRLLEQQYIKEFHESRFIGLLLDVLHRLGYEIKKPAK